MKGRQTRFGSRGYSTPVFWSSFLEGGHPPLPPSAPTRHFDASFAREIPFPFDLSSSTFPVHRHRRSLNHFRLFAAQEQNHPRDVFRFWPFRKIRLRHRLPVRCRID